MREPYPDPAVSVPGEETTDFELYGAELTTAQERAEQRGDDEEAGRLLEERREYTLIMDVLRAEKGERCTRSARHLEEYDGEAHDLLEEHRG